MQGRRIIDWLVYLVVRILLGHFTNPSWLSSISTPYTPYPKMNSEPDSLR